MINDITGDTDEEQMKEMHETRLCGEGRRVSMPSLGISPSKGPLHPQQATQKIPNSVLHFLFLVIFHWRCHYVGMIDYIIVY